MESSESRPRSSRRRSASVMWAALPSVICWSSSWTSNRIRSCVASADMVLLRRGAPRDVAVLLEPAAGAFERRWKVGGRQPELARREARIDGEPEAQHVDELAGEERARAPLASDQHLVARRPHR